MGEKKRIAILCSGGDSQGMNAAIHGCFKTLASANPDKGDFDLIGIKYGYQGLVQEAEAVRQGRHTSDYIGSPSDMNDKGVYLLRLNDATVSPHRLLSGSFLGSDRCPDFAKKEKRKEIAEMLRNKGIEILIVIGGNGSFTGAALFAYENRFPVIGIPGTIDNDIAGTDYTIGLDTARTVAREAVRNVMDTMSAFRRIGLVEVMGRDSGAIALDAAAGAGADFVILPERNPFTLKKFERLCSLITRNLLAETVRSACIVVAEGVHCLEDEKTVSWLDQEFEKETGIELHQTKAKFSLVHKLAPILQKTVRNMISELNPKKLEGYKLSLPAKPDKIIEKMKEFGAKIEVREVNLSHVQRGGHPTVTDIITASRMGVVAGLTVIESLSGGSSFHDWDPGNILGDRFGSKGFKPVGISQHNGHICLRPLLMMIKKGISSDSEAFRNDYARYENEIRSEAEEKKGNILRDYEYFKYASRVHPLKIIILD